MNPVERMNQARNAIAPARKPEIDQLQYLLDKAARLASISESAPVMVATPVLYESYTARQARLTAAMSAARASATARP